MIPPPHFHSLILWIRVAKQISTRKVNVTKRPAFALFLADLRESYGNPACSDTMEPKKPADWVVWAGKRKHSSTQRGRLGGKNIRHKVNKWANLKRQTVAAVDSFHCLNAWFHFEKVLSLLCLLSTAWPRIAHITGCSTYFYALQVTTTICTICTTNIPDMLSMTSLFLIIHLTLQLTSQVLMQFQPVCHLTDYCTEMYSLVLCSVFTGQNNTKYCQLFFSKSAAEVACLRCSFLLIRFLFCSFFVLIWFVFWFFPLHLKFR